MDEASLDKLVAECRSGDKNAYAELVGLCARQVFAICLALVGNTHDAEDLAQEVLFKGFTRIGELRQGRNFKAWIAGIARHLCTDHLRRRRIGREAIARYISPESSNHEGYACIEEALARLPEQYRLPMILYYFDGQDTQKVADVLNLSQSAVCTRLSRARRDLRKLLGEQGDKS